MVQKNVMKKYNFGGEKENKYVTKQSRADKSNLYSIQTISNLYFGEILPDKHSCMSYASICSYT